IIVNISTTEHIPGTEGLVVVAAAGSTVRSQVRVAPRSHGRVKRADARLRATRTNPHRYTQTRMNRPPPLFWNCSDFLELALRVRSHRNRSRRTRAHLKSEEIRRGDASKQGDGR